MTTLMSTNINGNISAVANIDTGMITVKRNQNELVFHLNKSVLVPKKSTIVNIAVSDTAIFIGLKHGDTCSILTLLCRDGFITEGTLFELSETITTISKLLLLLNNTILLVADSKANNLDVYSLSDDVLGSRIRLEADDDIIEFGIEVVTLDDPSMLIIFGLYEPEPGDVCYSVTLYAFDTVQTLRTGITHVKDSNVIAFLDTDALYLNGIMICKIIDEKLVLAADQHVDMDNVDIISPKELDEALAKATKRSGVVAALDTKALPPIKENKAIDKDNMVLRHHLVVQQLLNNISLAIKEDRVGSFSIKTLELTEERVRITGLEYTPRG